MKTFLSIAFALSQMTANAQVIHALPDSNAMWVFGTASPPYEEFMAVYISNAAGDTNFNAITYSKVFTPLSIGQEYYGAIRSDTSGRSYVVPADSSAEFLLRDFSKVVGDTLFNVFESHGHSFVGELENYVVQSIDSVRSGTSWLKRVSLSYLASTIPEIVWIEKVGDVLGGPFNFARTGLYYDVLYCMSEGDTTYFEDFNTGLDTLNFQIGRCHDPSDVSILTLEKEARIYPIPFDIHFTIDLPEPASQVLIYNMLGNVIYRLSGKETTVFNISLYVPPGIYFLMIVDTQNKMLCKKLVKL